MYMYSTDTRTLMCYGFFSWFCWNKLLKLRKATHLISRIIVCLADILSCFVSSHVCALSHCRRRTMNT